MGGCVVGGCVIGGRVVKGRILCVVRVVGGCIVRGYAGGETRRGKRHLVAWKSTFPIFLYKLLHLLVCGIMYTSHATSCELVTCRARDACATVIPTKMLASE